MPGIRPEDLIRGSGPLGILALTDDVDLQCRAAAAWVERKTEPAPRRLAPLKVYGHQRVRIGYLFVRLLQPRHELSHHRAV